MSYYGLSSEESRRKANWAVTRAAQLINEKVESVKKTKSVTKSALMCGVLPNSFVRALRKYGHQNLVYKYDDRESALERRPEGFKPSRKSEEPIVVQEGKFRLKNKVKVLRETQSLVKAAEQLGMTTRHLAFYFRANGYSKLLDSYDDR